MRRKSYSKLSGGLQSTEFSAFLIRTQAGENAGVTIKKVYRSMHSFNLQWLAGIIESQQEAFPI